MSQTLTLDRERRVVAGVCAGIAARFGYDPRLLRVVAVLLALALGFGLVAYAVLWALLREPAPQAPAPKAAARAHAPRASVPEAAPIAPRAAVARPPAPSGRPVRQPLGAVPQFSPRSPALPHGGPPSLPST